MINAFEIIIVLLGSHACFKWYMNPTAFRIDQWKSELRKIYNITLCRLSFHYRRQQQFEPMNTMLCGLRLTKGMHQWVINKPHWKPCWRLDHKLHHKLFTERIENTDRMYRQVSLCIDNITDWQQAATAVYQKARPNTLTMQYIVLFSHRTVQLPKTRPCTIRYIHRRMPAVLVKELNITQNLPMISLALALTIANVLIMPTNRSIAGLSLPWMPSCSISVFVIAN